MINKIILQGDIQLFNIMEYEKKLKYNSLEKYTDILKIDMSNVGYIDLSGVLLFLKMKREYKKRGIKICLEKLNINILKLFKEVNLIDEFKIKNI
ncbi:STAS domain-containing protein [Haliovirga abyssi]|uniref:STAS domain-containing protein n=1 Tax=Haliovirga abyssi TaxID=2996794 RepID=A0AAU9DBX8_9FUSO|nr:STAS domain-containing protein [Haliovirga abyssi]BDU50800.1 hypothetical protein HLVA_13690 [Haliovirga abyssi]